MTVRSVKISLDKEYELRFEQDDVIACEEELKMGYIFFFRVEAVEGRVIPVTLSLKLLRPLIHHGLRVRNARGDLEYALPQTAEGAKMAGDLIMAFKQKGGLDVHIWEKCSEAFDDWFGPRTDDPQEKPDPDGPNSKNSHAAG